MTLFVYPCLMWLAPLNTEKHDNWTHEIESRRVAREQMLLASRRLHGQICNCRLSSRKLWENKIKTSVDVQRSRSFTVLALESSADDTCAAVVTSDRKILSNVVLKQLDKFVVVLCGGFSPTDPSCFKGMNRLGE